MIKDYDNLFKIVIIGDSGCGKSSILTRFSDDEFDDNYLTTLGKFKSLQIENKNIKIQIWDTAGQERFRTITNAYYKGAHGIIMVYDITSQGSFDAIKDYWYEEIKEFSEQGSQVMLLGNKTDLEPYRQVKTENSKQFALEKKMNFFECSAKQSININDSFEHFINILLKQNPETSKRQNSSIIKNIQNKKQKCC